MNYLQKAVEELQPTYTTPSKVQQYVKKHKFDFLIKNPPYDRNRIQGFNKVFKK
jgi:type I restriction-modification system DNA methylase subunit